MNLVSTVLNWAFSMDFSQVDIVFVYVCAVVAQVESNLGVI